MEPILLGARSFLNCEGEKKRERGLLLAEGGGKGGLKVVGGVAHFCRYVLWEEISWLAKGFFVSGCTEDKIVQVLDLG